MNLKLSNPARSAPRFCALFLPSQGLAFAEKTAADFLIGTWKSNSELSFPSIRKKRKRSPSRDRIATGSACRPRKDGSISTASTLANPRSLRARKVGSRNLNQRCRQRSSGPCSIPGGTAEIESIHLHLRPDFRRDVMERCGDRILRWGNQGDWRAVVAAFAGFDADRNLA